MKIDWFLYKMKDKKPKLANTFCKISIIKIYMDEYINNNRVQLRKQVGIDAENGNKTQRINSC